MSQPATDCPHCGERETSIPCCTAAREQRDRERQARDAIKTQHLEILNRLGIQHHEYPSIYRGEWIVAPDLVSLFAFLQPLVPLCLGGEISDDPAR